MRYRDLKSAIHQMCLSKKRFPSKGKAEASARSKDKRFGGSHKVVLCSICYGWHVN